MIFVEVPSKSLLLITYQLKTLEVRSIGHQAAINLIIRPQSLIQPLQFLIKSFDKLHHSIPLDLDHAGFDLVNKSIDPLIHHEGIDPQYFKHRVLVNNIVNDFPGFLMMRVHDHPGLIGN
jgi:hypothetical protein